MDRERLRLERHDVECLRVIDQSKAPLRRQQFDDLIPMLVGVVSREDQARRADPERRHLFCQRFAVIDHMMRAECLHPVPRLGP
jgi:hypothetical protein